MAQIGFFGPNMVCQGRILDRFDRIFQDTWAGTEKTLFTAWSTEPSAEERDKLIDEVALILNQTRCTMVHCCHSQIGCESCVWCRWLAGYKGSVKAQIRDTCQAGAKPILVLIDGGPITCVEVPIKQFFDLKRWPGLT